MGDREYGGYETGPIRPPSEARSLLIRVTRNCPWNKCRFCEIYKGKKFSIRRTQDVLSDIETIKLYAGAIEKAEKAGDAGAARQRLKDKLGDTWEAAYFAASRWLRYGMESVFLQDANSMIIRTGDMLKILGALKSSFPGIKRITTYSRSGAAAGKSAEDLKSLKDAGLCRVHIGMESGSDRVLGLVGKGADKATHIEAGLKVKKAGMELSLYYMPGLGGLKYIEENALETADALKKIDPDHIRIRSLAVTPRSALFEDCRNGVFTRANDVDIARELLLMIENLDGISSSVVSDHIVNLLPEVSGALPHDKQKMTAAIRWFLGLGEEEQLLFRIGRRTNAMKNMQDFRDDARRARARKYIEENGVDSSNVDETIDKLMSRFI